MAGGPIFPSSSFPLTNGIVFPNFHIGAGSGVKHFEGLGVADATTIIADSTWELTFQMPPALPTGTAKLRVWSVANAVTGVLKINPKWASVAPEEDYSSASLNAEGTGTITWASGDADVIKETLITLDADTIVVSELIVMDFVIEDTSTTLAVNSTHQISIIWE